MLKSKIKRPHQFCAADASQNKRWGLFALFGMWNLRKANKAQMIAEYVLIIALTISAVVTMNMFVKRLLQAKIRDARNYMIKTANNAYESTNTTPASIPYEYEPYYVKQSSDVRRQTNDTLNLTIGGMPGYASGAFKRTFNQATSVNAESEQLGPKDAN